MAHRSHHRTTLLASAALGSTALVLGVLVCATPASALSSYSIKLPGQAVRAGSTFTVKIDGVYSTPGCAVSMVGAKKTAPISVKAKNYVVTARIKAPAGTVGQYRVKVACGKGGAAMSDPIMVVAKTSPLQATCDVAENGFLLQHFDYANFGSIIHNASPELTATDVQLALTYRDAAGNVVTTASVSNYTDIGPGSSVIVSDEFTKATGAVSVTVATTCKTALTPPAAPIPGTGTWAPAAEYSSYQHFAGQFVNPLPYTLDDHSRVDFVLRNAAGQIVAGGLAYLDAFVPPGAPGTWSTTMNPGVAETPNVQYMVYPKKQT